MNCVEGRMKPFLRTMKNMHKDFEDTKYQTESSYCDVRRAPEGSGAIERGVNTRRRNILKWAAFGGGAFVLGKIFGPSVNLFNESSVFGKAHIFKNFRVVESGKELGFYDSMGNEILVLEKDPHAGE